MTEVLEHFEVVVDGNGGVVLYKDKVFSVSSVVGEMLMGLHKKFILKGVLEEYDVVNIVDQVLSISCKPDVSTSVKEVYLLQLETLFEKLYSLQETPSKYSKYIWASVTLFSDNTLSRFANLFRFFIPRGRWFYFAFLFLVLINVLMCFQGVFFKGSFPASMHVLDNTSLSIGDVVLFYVLFLVILVFHEFGHASALYKLGRSPKAVGFGLYMFFPVFYADVTELWLMPKWDRILVNLAGVYMQLLVGALLFSLTFFVDFESYLFIKKLSALNIFVVLYSLMPFFRSDGYWIYSDLFGIKNLLKSSSVFLKNIFSVSGGSHKVHLTGDYTSNYALAVYAVSNFIFWHYLLVKWCYFFFTSFAAVFLTAGGVLGDLRSVLAFVASAFFGYFIVKGVLKRWGLLIYNY